MMIDYEKVNGKTEFTTIKPTIEALNDLDIETLDRYVSDARLDAMIAWLASYYHFVRANCITDSEPGWYHNTVADDTAWATERYETLARYRMQKR